MNMKAATSNVRMTKQAKKEVVFTYFAPQAKEVQLGGSFNNWNPAKASLRKDKKGEWQVTLELAPGRYEYRYFVDGAWQNDQRRVECVPNAFGSWNCVIQVQ